MDLSEYKENLDAAREDLISYSIMIQPRYEPNWHHEELADALMEVAKKLERKEPARLIIEMPPRHGKSELCSIKFPTWLLGKDPTRKVILSSYAADLAENFGGKARECLNEKIYKDIFPRTKISTYTRSKGNWATTDGGEFLAVGVGGQATGKGADVFIVDDPVKNAEEASSDSRRQAIWDWYQSVTYTRLEGYGAIIIVMTRWHMDDLVGRLLEQQKENEMNGVPIYDKWEVIRFPAIAEDEESHRHVGESLWPDKYDLPNLAQIRSSVGDKVWFSLYQQNPIAVENAIFKREQFKYYTPADLKGKNLFYATTVDAAASTAKRADNSVILTVAKEINGPNWYRIEETAGKYEPSQLMDAIFMHFEKYHGAIWLETAGFQKSLYFSLKEEMSRRKIFFYVNEVKTRSNKNVKIGEGLEPLYSNRYIHHLYSDGEYESELLQFPNGAHDDRIDAMAMQLEAQPLTKWKKWNSNEPQNKPRVVGNYFVMRR